MNSVWEMNPWQLMVTGGPVMIPILICSLFALTIIIEKFIYFANIQTNTTELKKKIFDCIIDNKIKEAVSICDTNPSPLAKILKAGIVKFGSSREEIKGSLEAASLYEIPKLEKNLSALATIAHISPLLGLLGTVMGMISCFHSITVRTASLNQLTLSDLSMGIWEALIATVAGLIVAIPAYLTYNYFVTRINQFVLEMERGAAELINLSCQTT